MGGSGPFFFRWVVVAFFFRCLGETETLHLRANHATTHPTRRASFFFSTKKMWYVKSAGDLIAENAHRRVGPRETGADISNYFLLSGESAIRSLGDARWGAF